MAAPKKQAKTEAPATGVKAKGKSAAAPAAPAAKPKGGKKGC